MVGRPLAQEGRAGSSIYRRMHDEHHAHGTKTRGSQADMHGVLICIPEVDGMPGTNNPITVKIASALSL